MILVCCFNSARRVPCVHADDAAWCDHMFSRVNSSSFLSGIIDWSYVHRRFSFLKHDNLMAHHVKAFWIVHHIVCVCLIALTDALMIGNAGILLATGLKTLCFSWWNLQCEWFRHYRICSCQETRNESFITGDCPGTRVFANSSLPDCQVIAYLWSCWDEPVIPVRCHISLRKSRVQLVVNDSMWNAGKGVLPVIVCNVHICGWTKLHRVMLVLFNTAMRWWLLNMWKRCSDCLHVSDLMVPFRVFRVDRKSSFHCCLLVSGKHLSGIDGSAWIQSWMMRCEHWCECEHIPPAR